MTLKESHFSSQTKINFLFYHVAILFTRFRVRVVAKAIGMTKRCLSVRLKEHATQVTNSAIGINTSLTVNTHNT